MAIQAVNSAAGFDAGWWLDWAEGIAPGAAPPAARRCPVGDLRAMRLAPRLEGQMNVPATYALSETTVEVRAATLELRFCGAGFECNQFEGDGLLVVAAPPAPAKVAASLSLAFGRPVRGLGAYVAAGSTQPPNGAAFTARLWVRTGPSGRFVLAASRRGTSGARGVFDTPPGVLRGAPFLGALSDADDIQAARFELLPAAGVGVGQLALSQLHALS
jgi:hypothetical protein